MPPGAGPLGGGLSDAAGFEDEPYPPRFSTEPVRREPLSSVAKRWPPSGVDELKVRRLLPPDEQTARSQPWAAVVITCELPGLGVDLDRGGEVQILWLRIARWRTTACRWRWRRHRRAMSPT